jgi:hypothetical protein
LEELRQACDSQDPVAVMMQCSDARLGLNAPQLSLAILWAMSLENTEERNALLTAATGT